MGKLRNIGYELRDVAVVQAPVSFINHRGEANPFINVCNREVYPIFVAPMGAVTDEKNYQTWIDNKVTPVVPRSVLKTELNPNGLTFVERMEIAKVTFVSISLKEAQVDFIQYMKEKYDGWKMYICIDIAHGTLSELYDICKKIKSLYGDNVEIMTGNVANPSSYSFYADAGVDICRVGIGGGSRCTSSANVSIHFPMATLIDMLNEERKAYSHSHNGKAPTKLIADGGIGWFDDIQKALALGADAVMIGKLFAECDEACGSAYYTSVGGNNVEGLSLDAIKKFRDDGVHIYRDYWGMSTKKNQRICACDGKASRTSEGISKPVEVKYPVAKWIDNMQSYLRSCMTYTNSHTIKELRENAQVIILGGSGDAAYRK